MAGNASNRRAQLHRQQEAARQRKRLNLIIGVTAGVVALVLIGVFGFVVYNTLTSGRSAEDQIVPPNVNAESNALVINETPAPDGAPVVTLYLDYQCPNCRSFESSYGPMLESEAQAGTWTLQYKTMVFMDNGLKNTASVRAAQAAACAANQNYYTAYHNAVFQNQEPQEVVGSEGYSDTLLRQDIPNAIGMSAGEAEKFAQCYDTQATADFVGTVDRSAYADGVTGTPSMAVNGTVLDFTQMADASPEGLKQFILANA